MKQYDVVALGELLIDFAQNGTSLQGNNLFEACPGGGTGGAAAYPHRRWEEAIQLYP